MIVAERATLDDVLRIAVLAHRGKRDKGGAPYILHPLRLLLRMQTEAEMMAGVLHDVVEDSDWTLDQLRAEGIPAEVIDAIDHLTRREREGYEDFIARVGANPLARRVKLADLEDNLNLLRLPSLDAHDLTRLQRYLAARRTLLEAERA